MINYHVLYVDMPVKILSLSYENDDESYTIILNSALSMRQNRKSLYHEIKMIENGCLKRSFSM